LGSGIGGNLCSVRDTRLGSRAQASIARAIGSYGKIPRSLYTVSSRDNAIT
jgi:hypothetical protein